MKRIHKGELTNGPTVYKKEEKVKEMTKSHNPS